MHSSADDIAPPSRFLASARAATAAVQVQSSLLPQQQQRGGTAGAGIRRARDETDSNSLAGSAAKRSYLQSKVATSPPHHTDRSLASGYIDIDSVSARSAITRAIYSRGNGPTGAEQHDQLAHVTSLHDDIDGISDPDDAPVEAYDYLLEDASTLHTDSLSMQRHLSKRNQTFLTEMDMTMQMQLMRAHYGMYERGLAERGDEEGMQAEDGGEDTVKRMRKPKTANSGMRNGSQTDRSHNRTISSSSSSRAHTSHSTSRISVASSNNAAAASVSGSSASIDPLSTRLNGQPPLRPSKTSHSSLARSFETRHSSSALGAGLGFVDTAASTSSLLNPSPHAHVFNISEERFAKDEKTGHEQPLSAATSMLTAASSSLPHSHAATSAAVAYRTPRSKELETSLFVERDPSATLDSSSSPHFPLPKHHHATINPITLNPLPPGPGSYLGLSREEYDADVREVIGDTHRRKNRRKSTEKMIVEKEREKEEMEKRKKKMIQQEQKSVDESADEKNTSKDTSNSSQTTIVTDTLIPLSATSDSSSLAYASAILGSGSYTGLTARAARQAKRKARQEKQGCVSTFGQSERIGVGDAVSRSDLEKRTFLGPGYYEVDRDEWMRREKLIISSSAVVDTSSSLVTATSHPESAAMDAHRLHILVSTKLNTTPLPNANYIQPRDGLISVSSDRKAMPGPGAYNVSLRGIEKAIPSVVIRKKSEVPVDVEEVRECAMVLMSRGGEGRKGGKGKKGGEEGDADDGEVSNTPRKPPSSSPSSHTHHLRRSLSKSQTHAISSSFSSSSQHAAHSTRLDNGFFNTSSRSSIALAVTRTPGPGAYDVGMNGSVKKGGVGIGHASSNSTILTTTLSHQLPHLSAFNTTSSRSASGLGGAHTNVRASALNSSTSIRNELNEIRRGFREIDGRMQEKKMRRQQQQQRAYHHGSQENSSSLEHTLEEAHNRRARQLRAVVEGREVGGGDDADDAVDEVEADKETGDDGEEQPQTSSLLAVPEEVVPQRDTHTAPAAAGSSGGSVSFAPETYDQSPPGSATATISQTTSHRHHRSLSRGIIAAQKRQSTLTQIELRQQHIAHRTLWNQTYQRWLTSIVNTQFIYHLWLANSKRQDELKCISAARKIQSCWFSYRTKREVKERYRKLKEGLKKNMLTYIIQHRIRKKKQAGVLLQRFFYDYYLKRQGQKIFTLIQNFKMNVMRIQRFWRGVKARMIAQEELNVRKWWKVVEWRDEEDGDTTANKNISIITKSTITNTGTDSPLTSSRHINKKALKVSQALIEKYHLKPTTPGKSKRGGTTTSTADSSSLETTIAPSTSDKPFVMNRLKHLILQKLRERRARIESDTKLRAGNNANGGGGGGGTNTGGVVDINQAIQANIQAVMMHMIGVADMNGIGKRSSVNIQLMQNMHSPRNMRSRRGSVGNGGGGGNDGAPGGGSGAVGNGVLASPTNNSSSHPTVDIVDTDGTRIETYAAERLRYKSIFPTNSPSSHVFNAHAAMNGQMTLMSLISPMQARLNHHAAAAAAAASSLARHHHHVREGSNVGVGSTNGNDNDLTIYTPLMEYLKKMGIGIKLNTHAYQVKMKTVVSEMPNKDANGGLSSPPPEVLNSPNSSPSVAHQRGLSVISVASSVTTSAPVVPSLPSLSITNTSSHSPPRSPRKPLYVSRPTANIALPAPIKYRIEMKQQQRNMKGMSVYLRQSVEEAKAMRMRSGNATKKGEEEKSDIEEEKGGDNTTIVKTPLTPSASKQSSSSSSIKAHDWCGFNVSPSTRSQIIRQYLRESRRLHYYTLLAYNAQYHAFLQSKLSSNESSLERARFLLTGYESHKSIHDRIAYEALHPKPRYNHIISTRAMSLIIIQSHLDQAEIMDDLMRRREHVMKIMKAIPVVQAVPKLFGGGSGGEKGKNGSNATMNGSSGTKDDHKSVATDPSSSNPDSSSTTTKKKPTGFTSITSPLNPSPVRLMKLAHEAAVVAVSAAGGHGTARHSPQGSNPESGYASPRGGESSNAASVTTHLNHMRLLSFGTRAAERQMLRELRKSQ